MWRHALGCLLIPLIVRDDKNICIWYLCPSQKQVIVRSRVRRFEGIDRSLTSIKEERLLLETQFIDTVAPYHE